MRRGKNRLAFLLFSINLFFASSLLFSQTDFSWNIKVGASNRVTEKESAIVASLKPYFFFKGFYGGLDMDFGFNTKGALDQKNWDNIPAISQKIAAIGYGDPKQDPYFFRFGLLENITLGYGFLVHYLRNDIYYPVRKKIGFTGGYDFGYTGLNTFNDDVFDLDFFGGRMFVRPLYWIENPNIPDFIKMLQIGIGFVTDLDPMDQDHKNGKIIMSADNPLSTPVRAYSIDLGLPLYKNDFFSIDNFLEYGDIQKIGAGLNYGFKGKVLSFLEYQTSLSYNWGGFAPHYFNAFYLVRSNRTTRFDSVATMPNGWGYFIGIYANTFENMLKGGVEFSDNNGEKPNLAVYFFLKPGVVKRLYIHFSYQRREITGIVNALDLNNMQNTIAIVEIGYEITLNAQIAFRYIRNYRENEGITERGVLTEIQTNLLF